MKVTLQGLGASKDLITFVDTYVDASKSLLGSIGLADPNTASRQAFESSATIFDHRPVRGIPTPPPMILYENTGHGFSLSHPADWEVEKPSTPDDAVEFKSAGGGFPWVNIRQLGLDHYVTEGTTISEFGRRVLALYETVATSDGEVVLDDGTTAYKALVVSEDFVRQYLFVFRGKQQFQFRTTSLSADFDRDKPVLDEMFNGFILGPGPLGFSVNDLPDATIGDPYHHSFCVPEPSTGLFCGGPLPSNPAVSNPTGGTPHYTFSHGIGLPFGLTLNFNGVLTGTPSSITPTGLRRFDVCANDQAGGKVCEEARIFVSQASVPPTPTPVLPTVTPVPPTPAPLGATWTGSYNTFSVGDGACTYNSSGTLRMTINVSGNSFSGSAYTNGLEFRYIPSCDYAYDSDSSGTVSGTISGDSWTLNFTFPTSIGTLTFEGTATLSGNSLSGRYLRTGGGGIDGSFTLTRE